jgi:hypothetical protein
MLCKEVDLDQLKQVIVDEQMLEILTKHSEQIKKEKKTRIFDLMNASPTSMNGIENGDQTQNTNIKQEENKINEL